MRRSLNLAFTFTSILPSLALTVGSTNASVVVPNALAAVEGNQASEFLTGDSRSTSIRYQQVFAASQFSGINTFYEIAFRPDAISGIAFSTTLSNTRISLSTTSKVPDGLSATFASNIGADETVVYSGNLAISSSDTAGPGGTRAFDIVVNLSTPFTYDPSLGNLLLDFQRDASPLNPLGVSFDAQEQAADSISRAFGSRSSPIAQYGVDTTGLVVRFAVPEPSSGMILGSIYLILLGFCRSRRN
jgi:hypothetical protein